MAQIGIDVVARLLRALGVPDSLNVLRIRIDVEADEIVTASLVTALTVEQLDSLADELATFSPQILVESADDPARRQFVLERSETEAPLIIEKKPAAP
jgi:hypothetical protein